MQDGKTWKDSVWAKVQYELVSSSLCHHHWAKLQRPSPASDPGLTNTFSHRHPSEAQSKHHDLARTAQCPNSPLTPHQSTLLNPHPLAKSPNSILTMAATMSLRLPYSARPSPLPPPPAQPLQAHKRSPAHYLSIPRPSRPQGCSTPCPKSIVSFALEYPP